MSDLDDIDIRDHDEDPFYDLLAEPITCRFCGVGGLHWRHSRYGTVLLYQGERKHKCRLKAVVIHSPFGPLIT